MKKIIRSSKAPAPIGPYNQAVLANGVLYVSGQIPINPDTEELVSESIQEETLQVMKNIEAILSEAGLGFQNVVKCSIFVTDMSAFGMVNEIYGGFFEQDAPARETVEVSALPKGVNVEISCIAIT